MSAKSILLAVAMTLGLLAAGLDSGHAQTSFRPGRDGGEFSGYEDYRAFLDRVGLLRAEPEPWHPLPQARELMDQLAANGDLRDEFLRTSWEEVETITAAIEASWGDCQIRGVEEINEHLRRLRRLGEEIRTRWGEVADIRDGVMDLYQADVEIFLDNVGDRPDVKRVVEESQARGTTRDILSEYAEAVGGRSRALRVGVLRFLGAVDAVYSVGEGAVMSYEAFRGYQRLPHILEKHEMIAYLNGLILQYRALVGTVNAISLSMRDAVREACPCLPERLIPDGQQLDLNPDSDSFRLGTLLEERDELRRRAQSGAGNVGYRLGDVERQIDEAMRRLTSRSGRDRASRAWYEQVEDNSASRRQYEQFRQRAQN